MNGRLKSVARIAIRALSAPVLCLQLLTNLTFADTSSTAASPLSLQWVRARGGFSDYDGPVDFHQAEIALGFNLPGKLTLGSGSDVTIGLESSAGWLGDSHEDAAVVTLGPAVKVSLPKIPVSIVGGSSPTFISRHNFVHRDLGSLFQFTSHIGLVWDVTHDWNVGYRFQHMSNAGIEHPNPGLNLHMFSVGRNF